MSTDTPNQSTATYYLANASIDDLSSLKAAIASHVFGIPLSRPTTVTSSTVQDLQSTVLLHGPALYTPHGDSVAFGGNSIVKAMTLLSPTNTSLSFLPQVDEWLEMERTCLRHEKDTSLEKLNSVYSSLEATLQANGGTYLVGKSLSAADIAVIVTLFHSKSSRITPLIQSYLDRHVASEEFRKGHDLLQSLVPPSPFDWKREPSVLKAVTRVFQSAVSAAFPTLSDLSIKVERAKHAKFGDYQCIAGVQIFQKLKQDSNVVGEEFSSPNVVAQRILTAIDQENGVIDASSLEVSGFGFIQCKVAASYLDYHVNSIVQTGKVTVPESLSLQGQIVVVDFSSPNIAKDMHVGHLRSTIIGESACRILEFVGADVKRVNHVGDWGTQFGMLITYLKEYYPNFREEGSNVDIGDLTKFYKMAKARFDEDADFKKTSQLNVVNLQAGDEECHMIWKILCDVSRREFEKVYKRLDITLEERGESFYNSRIPAVIKDFEEVNLIKIEEGGAKCVFVPGYTVPVMLQKSDGGYGYDSTDMTALKYRLQEVGASRIVYITDFSQGDHFQQCFAAARLIGWVDPKKHKLEHIGFGTVMGEDGKRFKTRSGDTVRLVDLLDEAVSRMDTSLRERIAENKANIALDTVPETSAVLGYGAVKYFDLRRNPTSNYKFSYDEMLDTRGNTAIYLLYAHARLESICTKGSVDFNVNVEELMKDTSANKIILNHPSERSLALQLQMFSDMMEEVLVDLYPYRICDYIYALSNAIADFVTQCKVLGSPEMISRLLLCKAGAIVMRQCFDLLGIRHVMRI